jgi:signal transduction histidine kinase
MRFDDRLSTALRQPSGSQLDADVQWRQLVDILAQHPRHFAPADVAAGLQRTSELSDDVAEQVRVASLRSLYGRLRSPPLISLLAHQPPAICAAAIASARLSDDEWHALIPELPSRARGYLRNRRDLGPKAADMLDLWKSADFRLPPVVNLAEHRGALGASILYETPVADNPPPLPPSNENTIEVAPEPQFVTPIGEAPAQDIGQILSRIEQLRRQRAQLDAPYLPLDGAFEDAVTAPDNFAFATDDGGMIINADLPQSSAIIGISIHEPAFDDIAGPDAYAAAAFQQRMPIENARMRLLAPPAIAGDWRIEAEPVFDADNGRFKGYSGIMRRPNCAEDAVLTDAAAASRQADQLQQLLHELRTPLGAIIGFGEIIEQQLFGPVSHDYRELAVSILEDAHRLLDSFDDMSMAAHIENGMIRSLPGQTDGDWLFDRIRGRLQTLTDVRGVILNLQKAEPLRPFALDAEAVERIFTRLLSAVVLGAASQESVETRLRTIVGVRPYNLYRIDLPSRLVGASEDELMQVGQAGTESEDTGPLLGLGFSLRLVRSLARNAGGDLRFDKDAMLLSLPALSESRFGI